MKNDKKKLRKERPWSPLSSMLIEDMKIAARYGEENLGRRYNTFRCVIDRDNKEEPIHCTGLTPEDQEPDDYNAWLRAEWARRKWQAHSMRRMTREEVRELLRGRVLRRLLPKFHIDDDYEE